ncbi:MAG: hypothetical protein M0R75_08280 [Dehalococcoidia bacterium]|nr:hypothetical protein [Dehalococcoidia bacterium]
MTSSAKSREGLLFLLYSELGPDRSLERLHALIVSAGVRVSLGTLKRYSSEFDWTRRVLEVEAESAARRHERAVETLAAQGERHAQLGRVFQTLAARAADARLRDPEGLGRASIAAIARAGQAGAEMERRAGTEQRDRQGAAVEIWNRLTFQLVPAFLDLNELPDPAMRTERFVEVVDRLADEHLRAIAEGGS